MVTVLYGPKGCGKTSLFRALHDAVRGVGGDVDVLIVSGEREAWEAERLYIPPSLADVVREASRFLGFEVSSTGEVRGFLDVAKIVSTIVGYIASMLREARRVLIVVDEVKADSSERLSELRGWLESFSNTLLWDNQRYMERGGRVAVIALTSDALVSKLRYKVGPKVVWSLMWNLGYEAMVELAGELELQEDPGILWRLTGGNPRALITIKRRGLERWIQEEILDSMWRTLREAMRRRGENIWGSLEKAVEDLDEADVELQGLMLENNIAIYVAGSDLISRVPDEKWVRRRYAYQIPAYHHAMKVISTKRTLEITPQDVIKEVE
jgi:energy-coupling factor transporter ATP-binding protein EcfA2